jgi:hypothetical protein
MKLSKATRIRIAATAVGLIALTAPVSAASAAGFTLSLTASSTPVLGKPMILHATGTIPPQDLPFTYWFSLDAISTTVTSSCPPDRWESTQFAQSTGGSIVVLAQREVPDAAGNFSVPVAVTPSAPGSVLLCAYTDDGAASTIAAASLILNIKPKQPTQVGSRPTSIPTEARAGIRSCLALLGPTQGRSCVQSVVRRANAGCRRLHSRSDRAGCLLAVRRIARRYS